MLYSSVAHRQSLQPQRLDTLSLFFWGFCSGFLIWARYWLLAFFLIFPLHKNRSMYLGLLSSLSLILLLYLSPFFLVGQTIRCERSTCTWNSSFLRYLPLRYPYEPKPGFYRIEKAQLVLSDRMIVPDVFLNVISADFIKALPAAPSSRGWCLSYDFFATFCLMKPYAGKKLLWRELFGALGLKHLLCISAWHAYHLLKLCKNRVNPFLIMGGAAALFLNLPVPFLIAYIKILIERIPLLKACPSGPIFMVAILAVILSSPFCWLNIGTWMTVYYILLIEHIGFCSLSLRLSSLGWAACMGWSIELLPWLIGWLIEPYFIYFWGLAGVFFIVSFGSLTITNVILDSFYHFLASCRIDLGSNLILEPMIGSVLLLYPFFTKPSVLKRDRRKKHHFEYRDSIARVNP